jgi:hypothetical protein
MPKWHGIFHVCICLDNCKQLFGLRSPRSSRRVQVSRERQICQQPWLSPFSALGVTLFSFFSAFIPM